MTPALLQHDTLQLAYVCQVTPDSVGDDPADPKKHNVTTSLDAAGPSNKASNSEDVGSEGEEQSICYDRLRQS